MGGEDEGFNLLFSPGGFLEVARIGAKREGCARRVNCHGPANASRPVVKGRLPVGSWCLTEQFLVLFQEIVLTRHLSGSSGLELDDIFSGWSLGAGYDVKGDARAFVQGLEAFALDRGMVNENILAAILLDETKTL